MNFFKNIQWSAIAIKPLTDDANNINLSYRAPAKGWDRTGEQSVPEVEVLEARKMDFDRGRVVMVRWLGVDMS